MKSNKEKWATLVDEYQKKVDSAKDQLGLDQDPILEEADSKEESSEDS